VLTGLVLAGSAQWLPRRTEKGDALAARVLRFGRPFGAAELSQAGEYFSTIHHGSVAANAMVRSFFVAGNRYRYMGASRGFSGGGFSGGGFGGGGGRVLVAVIPALRVISGIRR
jgi:hypothetical protein